jgi:hypothetical protein
MVSIMRRVYQTCGKRLRRSAIGFSDTTATGTTSSKRKGGNRYLRSTIFFVRTRPLVLRR